MRITDRLLAALPDRLRKQLIQRREVVKFLLVGGFSYVVTVVVNYGLKLTVLHNPVMALTGATIVASIVSYMLNREWSFRTRGGRRRHHEAALFFLVSALAVFVNDIPLLIARDVFSIHVPEVSRFVQEVSDFVSGMVLGTALAMVFRLWAFRKWVWPDENVRPRPARPGQAAPGEAVRVAGSEARAGSASTTPVAPHLDPLAATAQPGRD